MAASIDVEKRWIELAWSLDRLVPFNAQKEVGGV
jgi:hypothetical protein